EFPDIRVDYFRPQPGSKPALACFLSHIHRHFPQELCFNVDHLQGLEGFYGGPFIYCSEATKELLIRLERRAHRINFAKQVVEAHDFTHADKKLKLKTIPLETPTVIELGNGRSVRVTLFDANHCPGAVMFLIENDEKSILYTGDIRAEPWWVEAIARHPVLVPYTMGIKRLSSLYLDTSCASRENLYQDFVTKAEGIKELIEKIMKYPKDTTFHFNTWTFGYEDVWVALSAIHVDRYQHRLFRSIKGKSTSAQGPYLNGFAFGNSAIEGRLTNNPECRFHSCDRKLECPGLQGKTVVYIVPIITRVGNVEVQEVGIGQGDLEPHSELPLHSDNLKILVNVLGPTISPQIQELLLHAVHSPGETLPLEWGTDEKIAFSLLSKVLAKVAETKKLTKQELIVDGADVKKQWDVKVEECVLGQNGEWLPTRVSFPYSRHSSYKELRHLVGKFQPLDVYPCVVDENNWSESRSIRALFGDLCCGDLFAHDKEM
ncbi:beta-lactamase-like protein, partial [Tirmania nivea]